MDCPSAQRSPDGLRSVSVPSAARRSRFSFSNSVAGNAGSRSASDAAAAGREMRAHRLSAHRSLRPRCRRSRALPAAGRRIRTPAGRALRAERQHGPVRLPRGDALQRFRRPGAVASGSAPFRRASSSGAARPSCRPRKACALRDWRGARTTRRRRRWDAPIILHHRRDVGHGRRRRAVGLRIRDELAECAVRGLEVIERDADVGGREVALWIALQEGSASPRGDRFRLATPSFAGSLNVSSNERSALCARGPLRPR